MEDSAGETSDAVKKGVEEDPPAEGQADAAHTNSSTTDYGQNLNVIGSEASENKNVPIKDVPIGAKTRPIPQARTRTRPRAPKLTSMPELTGLQLHSPSTNIIGTPFTVTSTPYEYPFPPNAHASSSSETLFTAPYLLTSPLSLSAPTVAVTASPFGPDARSYSSTHPKLRTVEPPIPPGLVQKRQRWSLNLTRRDGSFGSQTSDTSTSPRVGAVETAQRRLSLGDASPEVTSRTSSPPGHIRSGSTLAETGISPQG